MSFAATSGKQANAVPESALRAQDYFDQLRTPFTKLCRLRFLQPDGSTAFALDNNPLGFRNGTFIQEGNITCNLQNGQRRTASVTLSNIDAEYDYNVNNIWFGQQIALDEGLVLSDGSEYYIQQGIFYIADPQETLNPNLRTMTYPLVDKWSYLDGSLFGRLESTYEVPVGTNIFAPIVAILQLDRGNGTVVDHVTPIFTNYYNGMSQTLPDGTSALLTAAPYTLRVDSDDGTYADVVLGLAEMLNAWVGYDQAGALRIDPSQDDIVDTNKPVLWRFSTEEAQLLGATYTMKNTEVFNDYIVLGEQTDDNPQAAGRAQNLDPSSDTNVNIIGRKTYRETASGYYTATQCRDLAEWKLKRTTVLQKAVSISCIQMMHIFENNLVEIVRTDKPGAPVERHLIQGYTRPLATNGAMTINAVSVADFPVATITSWPE
nr:MAG TPA: tail protein [Bacteriophage sp.]